MHLWVIVSCVKLVILVFCCPCMYRPTCVKYDQLIVLLCNYCILLLFIGFHIDVVLLR